MNQSLLGLVVGAVTGAGFASFGWNFRALQRWRRRMIAADLTGAFRPKNVDESSYGDPSTFVVMENGDRYKIVRNGPKRMRRWRRYPTAEELTWREERQLRRGIALYEETAAERKLRADWEREDRRE